MPKFTQRRKNMPREIYCQSEVVHEILENIESRMMGAMQRVALLHKATETNKELRQVVNDVFNPIFERLNEDVNDFDIEYNAMVRECHRNAKKMKLNLKEFEFVSPENFIHKLEVTHPIMMPIVTGIKNGDRQFTNIEKFWYAGILSEDRMVIAKLRYRAIYDRFVMEIYRETNVLKKFNRPSPNMNKAMRHQLKSIMPELIVDAQNDDSDTEGLSELVAEKPESKSVNQEDQIDLVDELKKTEAS
ncbi:hypothetical protein L0B53_18890 (plasmid) [Vibrio sp. SS-MA-C1-2]|uniref:hypothetical protein n=1 Tax=Vibrio sp. SS-MA-C1-2 TaxID=2908646 RepID=UPI001F19C996|nr:hypothetical protein [Vibrio sp. SS-MA-C1-2]UJF20203.1 hypothetical protein L0B53_18890 [Vibrio sp. SS-MA-C1-2]